MGQYGLILDEEAAMKAIQSTYKRNNQNSWQAAVDEANAWKTQQLRRIMTEQQQGLKSLGYQSAVETADAKYDYGQAMRQAYDTYLNNTSAVMRSNLGQGYKELYTTESRDALAEAYDAYRKAYLKQTDQINLNVANGVDEYANIAAKQETSVQNLYEQSLNSIQQSLESEAKNITDLTNATFGYLSYLYDNSPDLFKSRDWSKYNTYFETEDGKLDKARLLSDMTDIGLSDDETKLNEFAVEFFDQMINANLGQDGIPTFGNYLESQNSDLLKWANEGNSWYTYQKKDPDGNERTYYKRGIDIFKELVGVNDDTYSFGERLGALSDDKLNQIFAPYRPWTTDNKESFTAVTSFDDALNKLNDLSTYIVEDLGISASKYKKYFDDATQYLRDLQSAKNSYLENGSVSKRIDEKLNDAYKNIVDDAINNVKKVVKEDKDITLTYDAPKTINDIKNRLKSDFFTAYPDLLGDIPSNYYTKREGATLSPELKREIEDIWGNYDAYVTDYEALHGKLKKEKDSKTGTYTYYKDTDSSSYTALASGGYLPANAVGYYGGNNISRKPHNGLGVNIVVDGDTVEFQDAAWFNTHRNFLLKYMPDNSFFAYEENGNKRIIYKLNSNTLRTIGKVEKTVNGKSGQEMYDELFNKIIAHQHTSIQNHQNKAGTRHGQRKK